MKHATIEKLETPKFSQYAFTTGVNLQPIARNMVDTLQTERSFMTDNSDEDDEDDGPVRKPDIANSKSFGHSVESIRVSLESEDRP